MNAATLPRLLADMPAAGQMGLRDHLEVHGSVHRPRPGDGALLEAIDASGLRGRGGAGFPTANKLRAVRDARGRPVVVANACEGEPASAKDRLLLGCLPHLVLDGAAISAGLVGAAEVVIAASNSEAAGAAGRAIAERTRMGLDSVAMRVALVPDAFIAGEETALLQHLDGRQLKPTFRGPLPSERGLGGRPTLVQNAETLAHVALIARHGPGWFRQLGTPEDPGSALLTLSGAVVRPGVYEVESGCAVGSLVAAAGGPTEPVRALLLGGYFGSWVDGAAMGQLTLDDVGLAAWDARRGAGVFALLPAGACGPAEAARVLSYLAGASADQCGPCLNGLPAMAGMVRRLVDGSAPADAARHLDRWASILPGRGACHLPDGAVRFASSALRVFAAEFDDHRRNGPCDACTRRPILPVPSGQRRVAA
jgi:NADH:ubiquinone oxidoreductase subunit F (NADH-binding)